MLSLSLLAILLSGKQTLYGNWTSTENFYQLLNSNNLTLSSLTVQPGLKSTSASTLASLMAKEKNTSFWAWKRLMVTSSELTEYPNTWSKSDPTGEWVDGWFTFGKSPVKNTQNITFLPSVSGSVAFLSPLCSGDAFLGNCRPMKGL